MAEDDCKSTHPDGYTFEENEEPRPNPATVERALSAFDRGDWWTPQEVIDGVERTERGARRMSETHTSEATYQDLYEVALEEIEKLRERLRWRKCTQTEPLPVGIHKRALRRDRKGELWWLPLPPLPNEQAS